MGYVGHFKKEVTASQAQVSGVGAPAASQEKSADVNRQVSPKKLIKGKIIGKDSGLPLSGVSVKVSGTNIAAVTDIKGRFNLRADSNKTKLVIGYIGYQTLELNTRNPDSLQNIVMMPATSSLNEIVVTGYQAQKKTDDAGVTNAHPQAGWSAFKKYLEENAVSPDAKTGVVKLSFKVDHDGTISDVRILKGLSPATDQKAIDLINDGPDWAGNANGQPELVKVRVKFAQ
jgi:TonB family protein